MTDKYQQLKKVIQAVNPEIMELGIGCEIIPTSKEAREFVYKYGDDMIPEFALLVLSFTDSQQMPESYDFTDPHLDVGWEWGGFILCDLYSKIEGFDHETDIKILGRPIRLADVLLAVSLIKKLRTQETCAEIVSNWNLKDDNLGNQSEETKQFLIDLLVK